MKVNKSQQKLIKFTKTCELIKVSNVFARCFYWLKLTKFVFTKFQLRFDDWYSTSFMK